MSLRLLTAGLLIGLLHGAAVGQVTRLPATDCRIDVPVAAAPAEYEGPNASSFQPLGATGPESDVRMASHPDASEEPYQAPTRPGLPAPWMLDGAPPQATEPIWSSGGAMDPDDPLFDPAAAGLEPGEALLVPGDPLLDGDVEESALPPGARQGVFQKLNFEGAWMPRIGDRGVGMNELRLDTVLALPCPTPKSPLLIIPGYAVHYLDGPDGPPSRDLPPRLYSSYVQLRWFVPATERLLFDLSFTPGHYSDYEQSSDAAVRYSGHGFGVWEWTPRLKLVLGAVYVDREDIGVLPGGGVIWTPRDDWELELLFPRPRIARQVDLFGWSPEGVDHWLYVGGEFAGDTWAIAHRNGDVDELTYRDFRIFGGLECKVVGGLDSHLEVAYVLGRKFQFASNRPDFEPNDTFMLRGGVSY